MCRQRRVVRSPLSESCSVGILCALLNTAQQEPLPCRCMAVLFSVIRRFAGAKSHLSPCPGAIHWDAVQLQVGLRPDVTWGAQQPFCRRDPGDRATFSTFSRGRATCNDGTPLNRQEKPSTQRALVGRRARSVCLLCVWYVEVCMFAASPFASAFAFALGLGGL